MLDCWHELYSAHLPDTFIQEKNVEYFKQSLKKRADKAFIALLNQQVAGLIITSSNCIDDLWVSKRYRRKLIGTQLLNMIAKQFKQCGYDSMQVGCESFNQQAINFFESLNWKKAGSEPLTFEKNKTIEVIVYYKTIQ